MPTIYIPDREAPPKTVRTGESALHRETRGKRHHQLLRRLGWPKDQQDRERTSRRGQPEGAHACIARQTSEPSAPGHDDN